MFRSKGSVSTDFGKLSRFRMSADEPYEMLAGKAKAATAPLREGFGLDRIFTQSRKDADSLIEIGRRAKV
jgi:hypothetical protein